MAAVTLICHNRTKQLFNEHTVTVVAGVNASPFYLPRLPFRTLTSIARIEDDGTETALDATDYQVLDEDAIKFNVFGKMKIVYEAGYTEAMPIPDDIKIGAFSEIALRYENRGDMDMKPGLSETAIQYLTPYINTHYLL